MRSRGLRQDGTPQLSAAVSTAEQPGQGNHPVPLGDRTRFLLESGGYQAFQVQAVMTLAGIAGRGNLPALVGQEAQKIVQGQSLAFPRHSDYLASRVQGCWRVTHRARLDCTIL